MAAETEVLIRQMREALAARRAFDTEPGCAINRKLYGDMDRAIATADEWLSQQPKNQCGETCERAKLCAVCARGLEEQQRRRIGIRPRHRRFQCLTQFERTPVRMADHQADPQPTKGTEMTNIPEGWKLVPAEPTIAMLMAGRDPRISTEHDTRESATWAAMLFTAPQPPALPVKRLTPEQIVGLAIGAGVDSSDEDDDGTTVFAIVRAVETACAAAWGVTLDGEPLPSTGGPA